MEHVTVYREEGRFAGWPANYGIWSWGDEIVVGFTVGYLKVDHDGLHARDKTRPFTPMQGRSLDGGKTWHAGPAPGTIPDSGLLQSPGGLDFTHPDFALMCGRSGLSKGALSWFYTTTDRCRSWSGPYALPGFGLPGTEARTDYLVGGPDRCLLFLTAAKSNGDEGRVFCAETTDGGASFHFKAWIGPEPEGYAIMPASVRLSPTRILAAIRRREGRNGSIDMYRSDDDGASWERLNTPVADTGFGGNPPTLHKLKDGRLCLTYGYRSAPFGLRAKMSVDDGVTWDEEIVLRDDGGDADIGYPRSVERPDGNIVTAYYYNDRPDGERYIAATIWDPADF